ncbi:hypothetical protein C0J52_20685 [Blattella germanica]|nr:hypothetical protein C0J52_20685 [Blattella germanica]
MRYICLIVLNLKACSYFQGQSYEDVRCKCVCPNPSVVNGTQSNRKLNCDTVILPRVGDDIKGKEQEFCPRCECKYESRNTTIIKVVVIIVIWIISLLDEANTAVGGATSHAMGVRGNVLNRVGHQQDKWKRQVREQRRNIYDRHTMLN